MKTLAQIYGLLAIGILLLDPAHALCKQPSEGGTVQVHMKYVGSGTVDEGHKLFVVLWDSPAFATGGASGVMPLVLKTITSKSGTAVFTAVTKSPIYLGAIYDPSGQWDGQSGPPPAGSSAGMYSKEPGKPEPIKVESGKTTEVTLSFDDSYKLQ